MMEAASIGEAPVNFYQITRRKFPAEGHLQDWEAKRKKSARARINLLGKASSVSVVHCIYCAFN
jgi:hypothetical protein